MTGLSIRAAVLAVLFLGITRSLHAQGSGPFVETFRQGAINMSKQMFDVVNAINSVEEADAAEPKIAKIMNDFVIMLDGLAEYLEQGFEGNMESLNAIQSDPELKEWSDKVNARVATLQREHPDAAARLTEIGTAQSEKVMQAMTNLMQKLMGDIVPETNMFEEQSGE